MTYALDAHNVRAVTPARKPPTPDYARVAQYVKRRRDTELQLTQVELAARAGVSPSFVQLLEGNKQDGYRRDNLRKLAVGLGWTPDSLRDIANGDEPTLSDEPTVMRAASAVDISDLPDHVQSTIRDLIALHRRHD